MKATQSIQSCFGRSIAAAFLSMTVIFAWSFYTVQSENTYLQRWNASELQRAKQEVETYFLQHKKLPVSLVDMWSNTDVWSRYFIYRVHGKNFEIITYGRDGKPGGVGLDCDQSSRVPYPPQSYIPASFVLRSQSFTKTLPKCLTVGIIAFLMTFATLGRQSWQQSRFSSNTKS